MLLPFSTLTVSQCVKVARGRFRVWVYVAHEFIYRPKYHVPWGLLYVDITIAVHVPKSLASITRVTPRL